MAAESQRPKSKIDALMDVAFEWRALQDDPGYSEAQRKEFVAWLHADARHEIAYHEADNFWDQSDVIAEVYEPPLKPESRARRPSGKIFRPFREFNVTKGFSAIAMTACAALLVISIWPTLFSKQPSLQPDVERSYQTAKGEVSDFTLPDGSTLTLGARSAVAIAFSPDRRSVELISGDAFFDVSKNQRRPFEVNAGDLSVEVTGTAFDVRYSGHTTEVNVSEGTVLVTYPLILPPLSNNSPPERADMRVRKELKEGQAIKASLETGITDPRGIDEKTIGAWRDGRLIFDDVPLGDVLADFNRFLDDEVTFSAADLKPFQLSATVAVSDIENLLASLPEAFPIELAKGLDAGWVLTRRKDPR